MPPSAMTVCALPNSDLQMIAVRSPAAARLDGRAQAGAAGADDDDVVGVALDLSHVSSHRLDTCSVDEAEVGDPAGGDGHDVEVGEGQA